MGNELKGAVVNPERVYGKSAYEIAVMHGFEGTEEEWLYSLAEEANKLAKTYADLAGESAEEAVQANASAGEHEANAKTSEDNAKVSETNAKDSETKAKTSETNAKESEEIAKTYSENALECKSSSALSESNAKKSENAAKTSETKASASENNAKVSEAKALISENNAGVFATNAYTSETNAKESESNAQTYAERAEAAEVSAEASATAAEEAMNEARSIADGMGVVQTTGDSEDKAISQKTMTNIIDSMQGGVFIGGSNVFRELTYTTNENGSMTIHFFGKLSFRHKGVKPNQFEWSDITREIYSNVAISEDGVTADITIPAFSNWLVFDRQTSQLKFHTYTTNTATDIVLIVNSYGYPCGGELMRYVDSMGVFPKISTVEAKANDALSEVGNVIAKQNAMEADLNGKLVVTHTGDNLLNPSTAIDNSAITSEGRVVIGGYPTYWLSDYINITASETVYSDPLPYKIGWFDENKTYIEQKYGAGQKYFTPPENAVYFVAMFAKTVVAFEDAVNVKIATREDLENVPHYFTIKNVNIEGEQSNDDLDETDLNKIVEFRRLLNTSANAEPFIFFTDPHLCQFNGFAWRKEFFQYMKHLKTTFDEASIERVIAGGDWLGNSEYPWEACHRLYLIDHTMRANFGDKYVLVVGNHDTNYQGKLDEGYEDYTGKLPNDAIINLWGREHGRLYYKVASANTDFYILDTNAPNNDDDLIWDEDYLKGQFVWMAGDLQTNTRENIAVFGHILLANENGYMFPWASDLINIIEAFNNRGTVTVEGQTFDYTKAVGKIRFCMCGHKHRDMMYVKGRIPFIMTTHMRDGGVPTYDMCLADYENNKLYLKRIGTGEDRTFDI